MTPICPAGSRPRFPGCLPRSFAARVSGMEIRYEAPAVRDDLAAAHVRYWRRLARSGANWSGAERVAIAREVRHAAGCAFCRRLKAALSPCAVDGVHDAHPENRDLLPAVAVDAVHRIVNDASRLTRGWYERTLAGGLTDGQYVELVGTVVSVLSIDSFCRGVGAPPHPLPEPKPGSASGYRPETAAHDGQSWVPMVPIDNSGTPEADLWPPKRTGNVIRALSLAPDEVRTLNDLGGAHYIEHGLVRDPAAARAGGALSRAQIELVAGRVSILNDCFY